MRKLRNGKYTYRGYTITRHDGRGVSRWRWVWEIVDKAGAAWGHWPSLRMCKADIDADNGGEGAGDERAS